MKISVSLPDDDVDFLDEYAQKHSVESRSAVLQRAVRMLRSAELGSDYARAWDEFEASGDHAIWGTAVDDGLSS